MKINTLGIISISGLQIYSHGKKSDAHKLAPQAGIVAAAWLPLVHIREYILTAFFIYRHWRWLFSKENTRT